MTAPGRLGPFPHPPGRCVPACWTPVVCTVCRMRKAPAGRSVPLAACGSYCEPYDCAGYWLDPQPPHLWSELDSDRSYYDPTWVDPNTMEDS